MFGSRSEEIAAICLVREELCGWEKVTLDAVMCLVKVYVVDLNVCCLNTRQRIVGGEDDAVLTYFTSTVCKEMNLLWICSGIVMSFTTMNVHHMGVCGGYQLKKLTAKLLCKENTRSNNNSSVTTLDC